MKAEVRGLEEANAAIAKRLREIGQPLTEQFVVQALMMIETRAAPYVPVDTSLLINSAFRRVERSGQGYAGEVGYGAEYAGYVHDGGPKNWQKAGATDNFLLRASQEFVQEDLDGLIERNYK